MDHRIQLSSQNPKHKRIFSVPTIKFLKLYSEAASLIPSHRKHTPRIITPARPRKKRLIGHSISQATRHPTTGSLSSDLSTTPLPFPVPRVPWPRPILWGHFHTHQTRPNLMTVIGRVFPGDWRPREPQNGFSPGAQLFGSTKKCCFFKFS